MSYSRIMKDLKLVTAGDHMILLYNTELANAEINAAYIASRVMRNEKCACIIEGKEQKLLIEKLDLIIDSQKAISTGQVLLIKKEDSYSKDGFFNPEHMISLIKEYALQSIVEGYSAFAITGELSWVFKSKNGLEKIIKYETKLNNEIFNHYPVSAICGYNLHNLSSKTIKNIIELHPIIIWEGQIHDNPFYFPSDNMNEMDMYDRQVQSMLNTMANFTNTKSRFHNELKESKNKTHSLQLDFLENVIVALSNILEVHDKYTKSHSENVAEIAKKIAITMRLPEEQISDIYFAGLVHDIGKTIIPSSILNKKGSLTKDEFAQIKKHPEYGYKVLSKTDTLKPIANLVLYHHERVDGEGYPTQKSGEDIPIGSRILVVADSYDAMVNDRPYRKAMSKKEALIELKRCQGSHFDENVVRAFIQSLSSAENMLSAE